MAEWMNLAKMRDWSQKGIEYAVDAYRLNPVTGEAEFHLKTKSMDEFFTAPCCKDTD